jgi:oligosaccharide reducing-end xylanase
MALLSAVAMLSAPATAAYAASSPARHAGAGKGSAGASHTGVYPNVFARAGYSPHAIDARVNAAWQQLFHGDPGTELATTARRCTTS